MNKPELKEVTVYTKEEGSFKNRLTNVGTIIGLVSLVCIILTTLDIVPVDNDKVQTVTYCICSVGVLLGVFNNPKGSGIYLPFIDYPIFAKPGAEDIKDLMGSTIVDVIDKTQKIDPAKESESVRDKLEHK